MQVSPLPHSHPCSPAHLALPLSPAQAAQSSSAHYSGSEEVRLPPLSLLEALALTEYLLAGGLAGYRTHRRMKGLEDVRFEPIRDDDAHEIPQIPSLTATSASVVPSRSLSVC